MPLLDMVPALFFRKWVAIDNRRLFFVQQSTTLAVVGAVIYALITNPIYNMSVEPVVRYNFWGSAPYVAPGADIAQPEYCSNSEKYDYDPGGGWSFTKAKCAEVSNSMCRTNAEACVQASEIIAANNHGVWFATAFTEEKSIIVPHVLKNGTADATDAQKCENYTGLQGATLAIGEHASECKTTKSYFIPGIENFSLQYLTDYSVQVPSSLVHDMFGIQYLPSTQLVTYLLDPDDNILRDEDGTEMTYTNSDRMTGHHTNMTIKTALRAAGVSLDDIIEKRVQEFPDHKNPINENGRPYSRVVGMDLVFTVSYTNDAYPKYSHDGPAAELRVTATPSWMPMTKTDKLDMHGSVNRRSFNGIRIVFHEKGYFKWFQLNLIIYNISLAMGWMSIPFFVVFYFAISCLGTLSEVYTGFLYENVDMQTEFNGVSARMLEKSYSFSDMHDIEEDESKVWGVSLHRAVQRMDMILEGSKELDREERKQFTNFFFQSSQARLPSGKQAMVLETYMRTHMSDEKLLFEDILSIIDSDQKTKNILERFFMDESLKAFTADDKSLYEGVMKKRKEKDMHAMITHDTMLEQLRRTKDMSIMAKYSNLARSNYGQMIVAEQMESLDVALAKLNNKCDKVKDPDRV